MFFSSKKVVAVDIGFSSIKVGEFDVDKNGAKLTAFAMGPTPSGAYVAGDVLDQQSLSHALIDVVSQARLKRKMSATSLAGSAVIVKKITIPRIEKKLVAEQIRWEAEQYIPFDINSISLSHHIIPNDLTPDTMDILLVAAQKEIISSYQFVLSSAGLQCGVVDVDGFALANAFEFNYGKMLGQTLGLLNVGASSTNFVVVHNGDVIFSRDMSVGGQTYTYEIHKEMGVSIPEAESLKLSAVRGEGVPDDVHSLISATTETIKEEIRNSIDYFSGTAGGMTLGALFVTGGGSQTTGLKEGLSQVTGLRCEEMNSTMRLQAGKGVSPMILDSARPYLGVLVGLGLRKVGDDD